MAQELIPPRLVKPIPPQIVNEGAVFGPIDLKEYIQSPNEESGLVYFIAELSNGDALPRGIICLSDGIVSGIPAAGTQGDYEIVIITKNEAETPFFTAFPLTIKDRISLEGDPFLPNLKTQVWEALGKNLPIPEMEDLFDRPLTSIEIYYLLQQFATLTIWDVYNLDTPSDKVLLDLDGASEHYHIYDRGSCLIGTPKELFSHKRTLSDALKTAKAMAREVYQRGWTIEFAGFNKMVRAGWVELQLLGEQNDKYLEVLHYSPTVGDMKIFEAEIQSIRMGKGS